RMACHRFIAIGCKYPLFPTQLCRVTDCDSSRTVYSRDTRRIYPHHGEQRIIRRLTNKTHWPRHTSVNDYVRRTRNLWTNPRLAVAGYTNESRQHRRLDGMLAVHARYRGRAVRRAELVERSAAALSTLDDVGEFEFLGVEDICAEVDTATAVCEVAMALL